MTEGKDHKKTVGCRKGTQSQIHGCHRCSKWTSQNHVKHPCVYWEDLYTQIYSAYVMQCATGVDYDAVVQEFMSRQHL